ncbi:stability/ partitioning determinant [Buttiauxella sp. B2]|uniref:stability/ partitioning determinant n=1 Tax=Buttiauxella sp. B2 TaxID=2587812 RepID=UPI0011230290|nr:stability/ partitioning determinant [Buttiauxella sp. B2]TNV16126.1 stability/ partitioning determinant [Buttiauxella sp. B2]
MSKLGLKLPNIKKNPVSVPDSASTPSASANQSVNLARFISDGDKRPSSNNGVPKNFRLKQVYIDILENEVQRTGLSQTDILKAALIAFDRLPDENEKNYWILESKKI